MKTRLPDNPSRSYRHVRRRAMERYNIYLAKEEIPLLEQAIRKRFACSLDYRPNKKTTQWLVNLSLVLGREGLPNIKVRYCHARRRIVTVVL